MSRNRLSTSCAWCDGAIVSVEEPRQAVEADCHRYFPEYRGMIVAHAECEVCKAPYLGWFDGTRRGKNPGWPRPETDESGKLVIQDTSHRHSFDDEPSTLDYPKFKVETIVTRNLTPWSSCPRCGGAERKPGECASWRCIRLSEGWIDCPKHGHGPNDKRCDDCWATGMVRPKKPTPTSLPQHETKEGSS